MVSFGIELKEISDYIISLYDSGVFSECDFPKFNRKNFSRYKFDVNTSRCLHDKSGSLICPPTVSVSFSFAKFVFRAGGLCVTDSRHKNHYYFYNDSDSVGWVERHIPEPPFYEWFFTGDERYPEEDHGTDEENGTQEDQDTAQDIIIMEDVAAFDDEYQSFDFDSMTSEELFLSSVYTYVKLFGVDEFKKLMKNLDKDVEK